MAAMLGNIRGVKPCTAVTASSPRVAVTTPSTNIVSVSDQTKDIRHRLFKECLGGGIIYLEAGEPVLRNGSDVFHAFRANSNFLYTTGINQPGFSCLLDVDDGEFTLLAPRQPPEASYWIGGLPLLEDLAEEFGADNCFYADDIGLLLKQGKNFKGKAIHTTSALADKIQDIVGASEGGKVIGGTVESTLSRCRAFKTDAEVACLLHANKVSGKAHQAMWRAARPGMTEYQLEAVFRHSAAMSGCTQLGYPCIVGSGSNGAILHYESNMRIARDGDMVLVDAGAEYRGYTADISRTFPVGGFFTPAQREMYEVVLAAQAHALGVMQAGASMPDVEAGTRRVLVEHLTDMGLVRGGVDELLGLKVDRVFMPHGISHHLGLDVHDVSSEGPVPKTLLEGHVVTCEPGLYMIDPLIDKAAADSETAKLLNMDRIAMLRGIGGVRIEDNVLIQVGGNFNLTETAEVPKTVEAIHAISGQAGSN